MLLHLLKETNPGKTNVQMKLNLEVLQNKSLLALDFCFEHLSLDIVNYRNTRK